MFVNKSKPQEKTYRVFDGFGLYLEVRPNGSKYWRLKYRYLKKEKVFAIGVYPAVSLKAARDSAYSARKLLGQNIDPNVEKQNAQLADVCTSKNTFAMIAHDWYQTKMLTMSKSHQQRVKNLLAKYLLPAVGHMAITDISPQMLLKVLRKIESLGLLETTHKTQQVAGQVFRFSIITGKSDRDPSAALKGALQPVQVKHHPAIIEPVALGRLLVTIEHYQGSPSVMAALKLSPLLFCRPGELRHMEWSEVFFDKNQWEIPAKKMKMNEPHIVPLCTKSLELLQFLKPITGRGIYVFPNPRNNNSRCMSENAVRTALRTLGYTNDQITPHGFRATARTLLSEVLEYPHELIEHQLAHAVRDATGRAYNRTQHLKKRHEMMQGWADYLQSLMDASTL